VVRRLHLDEESAVGLNRDAGSTGFLVTHNALRGVAALAVFVYHVQLAPGMRVPAGLVGPFLLRGYLWVDLFFMLSGFVLARRYRETLGYGEVSAAREFLAARVARVLPLHLVVLALMAAIVFASAPGPAVIAVAPYWRFLADPSVWDLALQTALVQIWHGPAAMSWNIPSWSISAEMHVYLLFPAVALAMTARPRLAWAAMLLAVLGIYIGIAVHFPSLDDLDWLALPRCLAGFLLGVILQEFDRRWPPSTTVAVVGQVLGMVWIVAAMSSPLPDELVVPGLALLVLSTARDAGLLGRLLRGRVQRHVGDISYSLYLLNFPLLLAAAEVRPAIPDDIGMRLSWLLVLAVALLGVATVTHRWIEVPSRTWLRSILAVGGRSRRGSVRSFEGGDPAP